MPYGIDANGEEYAECPRCGLVAHGKAEIERLFGYRDMGDGRVIPQSHCRKCRLEELEEKR